MENTNRTFKDRLFKFIFGNPEKKEWTLSLYNAINGSDYKNPDEIEFTTLEDAVYMSMKNDVSFLLVNVMNLYEQQSTFNPNLPLRMLIYAGRLYSRYEEQTPNFNIYSTKLQMIPAPKCICFYNGTDNMDDKKILRLSDAYNGEADIEVTVTMFNINRGYNKKLMEACKPMSEYSEFVSNVRDYQKNEKDLSKAIGRAISEMPDNFLIKPFLEKNRAEVELMCITEYNEERHMEMERKEHFEQGREEGREQGIEIGIEQGREQGREEGAYNNKIETAMNLLADGTFSHEKIATLTNLPIEKVEELAKSELVSM